MKYVISPDGTMIAFNECVIVDLNEQEAQNILDLSDSERFGFAQALDEIVTPPDTQSLELIVCPHACGICDSSSLVESIESREQDGNTWWECSNCGAAHTSRDCCVDEIMKKEIGT